MPDIFPDQKNALVSIIIRSMARPTLAEALDSVAAQTWPALEAVVVNARGPGHPPPAPTCGRFPVRFIDTGRPLERSAAANAGLTAAHGHYVGFLDDDDLLFPDHVATLVNALQSSTTARIAYSGGTDDRLCAQWHRWGGSGAESAVPSAQFAGAKLYPDARGAVCPDPAGGGLPL